MHLTTPGLRNQKHTIRKTRVLEESIALGGNITVLDKVLAVEQPRNYTHLLNPFQQGSAVQESAVQCLLERRKKKDVGSVQDNKWIDKTFARRWPSSTSYPARDCGCSSVPSAFSWTLIRVAPVRRTCSILHD